VESCDLSSIFLNDFLYLSSVFHVMSDYFLPARRYASAACAGLCDSDVSVRPSVRTSVRHTPVLCLAERKQDREIPSFQLDTVTLAGWCLPIVSVCPPALQIDRPSVRAGPAESWAPSCAPRVAQLKAGPRAYAPTSVHRLTAP